MATPESSLSPAPVTRHNERAVALCHSAARVLAAVTGAVGAVVLMGWLTGTERLVEFVPGWEHMKPATAVALLASGLALGLLSRGETSPRSGPVAATILGTALVPLLVGVLSLVATLFTLGLGPMDQWLMPATADSAAIPAGRMSPLAAVASVLCGTALLLLRSRSPNSARGAQGLALGVVLGSLLPLTVHLSGLVHPAVRWPAVGVTALHSAIGFLALALGLLAVRPRDGLMALFNADSAGGRLARRLAAPVALAPFLLKWIEHTVERGQWLPPSVAGAATVVGGVLVIGTGLWIVAGLLHRHDETRRRVERTLAESEERYRRLVEQSPDGIVVKRRDRIVFVNPAAARLLGLQQGADAVGQPPLAYLHPDSRKNLDSGLCSLLAQGEPILPAEHRLQRPDGSSVEVELAASPVDFQGQRLAQIVIRDLSERRRAEGEVRRLRDQLQFLVSSTPIVLYSREADGHRAHTFISSTVERIFGYPPGELVGRPEAWLDNLHPEDAPLVLAELETLQVNGRQSQDYRFRHKNGQWRWVRDEYRLAPSPTGQPQAIVGYWQDISEHKKATELLRLHTNLVRSSNDAIFSYALDRTITTWNPAAEELFGFAADEVLGQPVELLHPSSGGTGTEDARAQLHWLEKADRREVVLRRKDGTPVDVALSISPIYDATAEIAGISVIARDITERNRAEQTIRGQATLLDQTRDAIVVTDLEYRIQYWSKGAERLYGWEAAAAVGRPATELIYQESGELEHMRREVERAGEWHGEMRHATCEGRPAHVEARCTLLRDEQGRPRAILAINTDITERKNIEAQFLRAQRVQSIGTLAGGIAHDLNNILAPILLSIRWLRSNAHDPADLQMVETVEQSAQRGADIVRQLLTFARGLEGQRVPLPPRRIVDEIARMIRETFPKTIRLVVEVAPDIRAILGDATQLHQVLLNFCVNARDAMPAGGTLTLRAENVRIDEHYTKLNRPARSGDFVVLKVADTGGGIAPEIRDRIFDPFFTTKGRGRGTGLGLSTALTIVNSHGGFIDVVSEDGKGSTFAAYFPAAAEAPASAPAPRSAAQLPRGEGEQVLVVDDEKPVRFITRQLLETFGYRVLLAENGAEAVELYTRHPGDIAVVVMDVLMPVMDGIAASAALRSIDPNVRILAASGMMPAGSREKLAAAGVSEILSKPFAADSLLVALRRILQEPVAPAIDSPPTA